MQTSKPCSARGWGSGGGGGDKRGAVSEIAAKTAGDEIAKGPGAWPPSQARAQILLGEPGRMSQMGPRAVRAEQEPSALS